ncbi:hypothetical protein Q8A67_021669 [Cirrhinus molitorella]|uniref:Uncharacterized protein n=1 Tax=Cirrhinus molitorella TaxID=172907 RepID=A0AA88PI08_9TELE|nr:hypothetical protein Q8A67_021669 [Cirrhinus molitorella]
MVVDLTGRGFRPRLHGELAQMVERSLSMREVAGSMPAFSKRVPAQSQSLPEPDGLRLLRTAKNKSFTFRRQQKQTRAFLFCTCRKRARRSRRDLNSDRWIQSPECYPLRQGTTTASPAADREADSAALTGDLLERGVGSQSSLATGHARPKDKRKQRLPKPGIEPGTFRSSV